MMPGMNYGDLLLELERLELSRLLNALATPLT